MRELRRNTATRVTVGPFYDKTDGLTPETGITVTSCKLTLVVDDAGVPTLVLDTAPTASGGANDMVHITGDDSGYYDLELAAANVNYLGRAVLSLTDAATHLPVFHEFMILEEGAYDAKYADVGPIPSLGIADRGTAQSASSTTLRLRAATPFGADHVNRSCMVGAYGSGQGYWQYAIATGFTESTETVAIEAWSGGVTPSGTIQYVVYAGAAAPSALPFPASLAVGAIANGAITTAAFADNALTAAKIATGAITNTTFADNAITAAAAATDFVAEVQSGIARTVEIPTATENRNALLNWEPFSGFSFAKMFRVFGIVLFGTKTGSGTATEIFTAPADGATVTATVDVDGNRSAVITDASGTP